MLEIQFSNFYFKAVKTILKIFLFVLIIFSSAYSQSERTNKIHDNDTVKTRHYLNPLTNVQIKFDEFELYREFKNMKMNLTIDGDPQTVWLRTALLISNSENSNQNFSPHFLSPLEKKYFEDSKFNPIKYVLGAAQVGAVGYLAYKHIKKYGFFK